MRNWKAVGRYAALMLGVLLVASCEHVESPTDIESTEEFAGEPQELFGLDLGGLLGRTRTVRAVDPYGNIRRYELVQQPLLNLDLSDLRVSELIGVNGGSITLLGHSLTVPAGAVDQPTLFTLLALPSGYVEVDASTLLGGLLGGLFGFNPGEEGFDRPVKLELSYDNARVRRRDEDDLVILRLNPRGYNYLAEVIPSTIDERDNTGTAWLEHFSRYCMAM